MTRRLVVMRHAKSAWPDVPDDQRPLAERGRRAAPAMGRWLRQQGHAPDAVLCSTAERARETWELAADGLGTEPPVQYEPRIYGADGAELLAVAREATGDAGTVLLVGHEPGVRELVTLLAARGDGASDELLDRVRLKFPTGGAAVLAVEGEWADLARGGARLIDFQAPRELTG